MRQRHRWSDPNTEFILEKSGTPLDEDGFKLGEPTGHIICEECGRAAMHIERINHGRVDGSRCPNAE